MNKKVIPSLSSLFLLILLFAISLHAAKKIKNPVLEETPEGKRVLLLPDDLSAFLTSEFPGHRLPTDTDFSTDMLQYYFSRLLGVYPCIASGDFNNDKKKDYLLLIITGDTKWGPICELVAVNGAKGGGFLSYRLSEVYNFKEDYVSFANNKLYKGRYQKNGWYINWDSKKATYVVTKS